MSERKDLSYFGREPSRQHSYKVCITFGLRVQEE